MRIGILYFYISVIIILIRFDFCVGQDINSHTKRLDLDKRDQFEAQYVDWGEYNNRIYRVKIRFPSECPYISENGPMPENEKKIRHNAKTLFYRQKVNLNNITFGDKISPIFSINIYSNPDSLNLEEFAFKIVELGGYYDRSEIQTQHTIICDKSAIKMIYENKVGGYTGFVTPTFIETDEYIISVEIFSKISNMEYQEFYDKVINSLRLY